MTLCNTREYLRRHIEEKGDGPLTGTDDPFIAPAYRMRQCQLCSLCEEFKGTGRPDPVHV